MNASNNKHNMITSSPKASVSQAAGQYNVKTTTIDSSIYSHSHHQENEADANKIEKLSPPLIDGTKREDDGKMNDDKEILIKTLQREKEHFQEQCGILEINNLKLLKVLRDFEQKYMHLDMIHQSRMAELFMASNAVHFYRQQLNVFSNRNAHLLAQNYALNQLYSNSMQSSSQSESSCRNQTGIVVATPVLSATAENETPQHAAQQEQVVSTNPSTEIKELNDKKQDDDDEKKSSLDGVTNNTIEHGNVLKGNRKSTLENEKKSAKRKPPSASSRFRRPARPMLQHDVDGQQGSTQVHRPSRRPFFLQPKLKSFPMESEEKDMKHEKLSNENNKDTPIPVISSSVSFNETSRHSVSDDGNVTVTPKQTTRPSKPMKRMSDPIQRKVLKSPKVATITCTNSMKSDLTPSSNSSITTRSIQHCNHRSAFTALSPADSSTDRFKQCHITPSPSIHVNVQENDDHNDAQASNYQSSMTTLLFPSTFHLPSPAPQNISNSKSSDPKASFTDNSTLPSPLPLHNGDKSNADDTTQRMDESSNVTSCLKKSNGVLSKKRTQSQRGRGRKRAYSTAMI